MAGDLRRLMFLPHAAVAIRSLPMPGQIETANRNLSIRTDKRDFDLMTDERKFVTRRK